MVGDGPWILLKHLTRACATIAALCIVLAILLSALTDEEAPRFGQTSYDRSESSPQYCYNIPNVLANLLFRYQGYGSAH